LLLLLLLLPAALLPAWLLELWLLEVPCRGPDPLLPAGASAGFGSSAARPAMLTLKVLLDWLPLRTTVLPELSGPARLDALAAALAGALVDCPAVEERAPLHSATGVSCGPLGSALGDSMPGCDRSGLLTAAAPAPAASKLPLNWSAGSECVSGPSAVLRVHVTK
jgi:hypothetical protein